jgi:hypothetical protein
MPDVDTETGPPVPFSLQSVMPPSRVLYVVAQNSQAIAKDSAVPGVDNLFASPQPGSSRDTPFLEIACRVDAGSLPLALLQLCCPASSLAATAAVALGCRAPGTVCPRRFGQLGVGGGCSCLLQCDQTNPQAETARRLH